jgi:hypothetical protein
MYTPGELPTDSIESLQLALKEELLKISESFKVGAFETINLELLSAALDKQRAGDLINADGDNYDPGNGAGIYWFNGTIYTKLG